ncbi:hypothetical protein ABBQ32_009869 [Trebouxia sp. C0010 RCD-2024]
MCFIFPNRSRRQDCEAGSTACTACPRTPSFDDLEAYLVRHPDVKLPVPDTKYYSLVAANEALMSEIEPASAFGAEALADCGKLLVLQCMTLYCSVVGIKDLALHLRHLAVYHD